MMMYEETVVNSRPDRVLKKKIITPGDYSIVPYEDSRCRITIKNYKCTNLEENVCIESESQIFNPNFDGNVLIGDMDFFVDRDVELILQQMCNGEVSEISMAYNDDKSKKVLDISCTIEITEITEEQLISDWSWQRLYEASIHHKEKGVELFKRKNTIDAFKRFNKSLKMLIAIEPIDLEIVPEETVKEMIDLKVKLYNNLAQCQLQFDEYKAALEICNKALKYDKDNIKALYRRCVSYSGLNMYEEAWADIQRVLQLDPNDKAAQQKANYLKPIIEKISKDYTNVIKKMFV